MNLSKLTMPVLLVAAIAALAGCDKRPVDAPMQPSTPPTSTTPMPSASAASR
jgi:type IV pilus biogenesis protein CpaD/CtpE